MAGEYKQAPGSDMPAVTTQDVIGQDINWASYVSLGVTAEDAKILADVQKTAALSDGDFSDDSRVEYRAPAVIAATLIKCARNVTQSGPPRQYLTLAQCFLEADVNFARLFSDADGNLDMAPFLRYIDSEDAYVATKAMNVCASLASVKGLPCSQEHRRTLMIHMADRMAQGGETQKDTLWALMVLLRNSENRPIFVGHPRATQQLIDLITDKTARQQLYEALFCLWAISYCEDSFAIYGSGGLVKKLAEVTLTSAADKIVRMGLAILKNMLGKEYGDADDPQKFNEDMVDADVLKSLGELTARQWIKEYDREDVEADIKVLAEELKKNFKVMSSFERYKVEVNSGSLRPGPVHSEKFWSENANRFEAKGFKWIKKLVEVLNPASGSDNETLATACYDIGEFARFYSQGKMVVRNLGGKSHVMQLMTHQDKDVAKQALQASAKLLISNWEHLGA